MTRTVTSFILIINYIITLSCNNNDNVIPELSKNQIRISKNIDSIFLLAQGIYLWNDQLPSIDHFNPNKFFHKSLSEIQYYENVLLDIAQYPIDKKTGELIELNYLDKNKPKYSSIISSDFQSRSYNMSNTFGLSLIFKNNALYILYVDSNSPAGKSGLRRGTRILSINDENISTGDLFLSQWKKTVSLSFIKITITEDGINEREVRLNSSSYDINPVIKQKIINSGDRKIGYLALNSFTEINNARKYLTPVFLSYSQEKITELIVDLRYNQGGYQTTANFLANFIAPRNSIGQVMYSEHYNVQMQNDTPEILKKYKLYDDYNNPIIINGSQISLYDIDYSVKANTIYFDNSDDNLPYLKKVYFIVSNKTASASELLINILKPYIEVQVLGVSDNILSTVFTYGKPIGSIGIPIGKFELYLAMYEIKNAKGENDYFKGIKSDNTFKDNIVADFGAVEDPVIFSILNKEGTKQSKISLSNDRYTYFFNNDRLNGNIKSKYTLKLKD